MHVRDSDREKRPRNSALVLLGLVVLLAVVALASSGHVALGTGATRRPGHELADTFLSLLVVFVLLGAVVSICVYTLQRTNSRDARRKGERAGGVRQAAVFLFAPLLVGLAARVVTYRKHHGTNVSGATAAGLHERATGGYTPHFAPIPVAIVLGAGAIAGIAAYASYRARRRVLGSPAFEPSLELTLAEMLRETLDDLRAEPDARVAVIAAYARLERTLAASGMPRRASDAPLEYLERILVGLDVSADHASRLTQLFEQAKFSTRAVGPEMKTEAIELLEAIRADLQAAEAALAQAGRLAAARVAGQPT